MNTNTRYLVGIIIIVGITSMMMIQQVDAPNFTTIDSETLREHLLDYIDAWQLENATDQSQ